MGIRGQREMNGKLGCQAVINGEVCHREDNATCHRKTSRYYHEYVSPEENK